MSPAPRKPYYAVIFASRRSESRSASYSAMASKMESLASSTPGFLGIDSARSPDRRGITVSYWESEVGRVACGEARADLR